MSILTSREFYTFLISFMGNIRSATKRTAIDPRLKAFALATAGALLVALVLSFALPNMPLNLYDVSFALLWGRELIEGSLPQVQLLGASTPHPASILTGAVAACTPWAFPCCDGASPPSSTASRTTRAR
jgi:hypothetical protein